MASTREADIDTADVFRYISNIPKYQWQPLENKTYRRLVHIHPAPKFEDPIVVSLSQDAPEYEPEYIALSYHWGNPELRHDVVILPDALSIDDLDANEACWQSITQHNFATVDLFPNLRRITIHDNLSMALRRLRGTEGDQCVWTDFLCINQSDNEEKSEQVQRMASVYADAAAIVVCLGEENEDHEILKLDSLFLRIKSALVEEEHTGRELFVNFEQFSIDLHRQWDEDLKLFGVRSDPAETYRLLKQLFRRPWFQRVWVVQEARPVLDGSKDFLFVLGEVILPWRLVFFAYCLLKMVDPFDEPGKATSISPVFQAVMSQDGKLIELLKRSQDLQASDPRDHCFALLSMSEYADRDELRPDYNEQVTDTFLRYTKFLIAEGYGPEILSLCLKQPNKDILLPSWAPDWSCNANLTLTTLNDTPYLACGSLAGRFDVVEGSILKVSGFIFDQPSNMKCIDFDSFDKEMSNLELTGNLRSIRLRFVEHLLLALLKMVNEAHCLDITDDIAYRYLMNDVGQSSQRLHSSPHWVPTVFQALKNHQREQAKQITDELGAEWVRDVLVMSAQQKKRQMCITQKGYLAKVPSTIQHDDVIAIVLGCRSPLVLRKASDRLMEGKDFSEKVSTYQIVGYAYVHGMMDGAAVSGNETEIGDVFLV